MAEPTEVVVTETQNVTVTVTQVPSGPASIVVVGTSGFSGSPVIPVTVIDNTTQPPLELTVEDSPLAVVDIVAIRGATGYSGYSGYSGQTPETITYPAGAISVIVGTHNSGDLTSIQTYNDGNVYSVQETATTPGYDIHIDFFNVVTFNKVQLNLTYTNSSTHVVHIDLYNNNTSEWDTVGTFQGLAGTTQFSLGVIDSTPYITALSAVSLRLYHITAGWGGHVQTIDYCALQLALQGPTGAQGISGYSGESGYSGDSGESGYSGESGFSGYSGIDGLEGISGWSGYSGDNPGTSGYSGLDGAPGIPGLSGESGYSGYSGLDGAPGGPGPQGFSGESGYSGEQGLQGMPGLPGEAGISGYSGQDGFPGNPGTPGTSGWSGFSGESGYSGWEGASGYSGLDGLEGISGYSGLSAEEEMVYAKRIDFITDDELYKGEAVPGSVESAAVWRIRKITIAGDSDVTEIWADGNANFDNKWTERLTPITYS